MKLSEMREILGRLDIQLTKSLGQNFLHDGNQLRRIVDAADLQPDDKVLEIGPGLGPLTESLLARSAQVLGIEMDARLVGFLRERFEAEIAHGDSRFRLVHDDALEFLRHGTAPGSSAASARGDMRLDNTHDWSEWKMVSNLPYSVASPILVELTRSVHGPKRITTTLQLEVARRLGAAARDKDYGILTLLVQQRYELRGHFKIPASCFFPEPEVDSACVTLVRRAEPLLPEAESELFVRVVKCAFSQRRKMMIKLLRRIWPVSQLRDAFALLRIPAEIRAEDVSLNQFVRLTGLLAETEPQRALITEEPAGEPGE